MKQNNERERDLQRLSELRPIDDDFMRCIFRDNIPLVQHILRIITSIEDLEILSIETQADMKRLVGARSVCLDAYGTDTSGRKYDIEIQRSTSGAGKRRARFHASVLDIENLNLGQDFNDLPETYIIFITEKDVFGEGKAIYPIERMNIATSKIFGDGEHILYVNGSYRGEDDLGKLMHDFCCTNPNDMLNHDLADAARYYKETKKGVKYMCEILEEMRNEVAKDVSVKTYIDACREFGITNQTDLIQRVLTKFSFLSKEQAERYIL